MTKKAAVTCMAVMAGFTAVAQAPGGREAFLKQQAYEEMQRVSGQMDVLESNHNALAERVARLEGGGGEIAALKAEIAALKAELGRVRSEMQSQRQEIVADIVKRIKSVTPPPAPHPVRTAPQNNEPVEEYTVRSGDTLSLISQAFGTTVGKIKELNNLKSDGIRVGQKLVVPGQTSKGR